eukprot:2422063-Lingulodinium_polyedra.AAC.1
MEVVPAGPASAASVGGLPALADDAAVDRFQRAGDDPGDYCLVFGGHELVNDVCGAAWLYNGRTQELTLLPAWRAWSLHVDEEGQQFL